MCAAEAIRSFEHELKYLLPAGRAGILRTALERRCRPDPRYPEGIVASIYYDTPRLHSLREKVDSDYLKTKVRVRWYEDVAGGESRGHAFAEAKHRIGTRRYKVREPVEVRGSWLARQRLTRSELRAIPLALQSSDLSLRQPLFPLIVVRYRRLRYVEPFSGVRVSLDTAIAPGAVNPLFAAPRAARRLSLAVLEVKGKSRRLPPSLRWLTGLGCRQASFSKYNACSKRYLVASFLRGSAGSCLCE